MDTVTSKGLDGKPHVWPASAFSRDKHGVYRDIKGRVVGGVAMDATTSNYDEFSPEVKAKIARAKAKIEDNEIADAMVAMLFPSLKAAVGADSAAEEQAAMGSYSSEEEAEANDDVDTSFEDSIVASAAASKAHWGGVKQRQSERSNAVQRNNAGAEHSKRTLGNRKLSSTAIDSVAANAKASRGFSMFDHPERMKRATA